MRKKVLAIIGASVGMSVLATLGTLLIIKRVKKAKKEQSIFGEGFGDNPFSSPFKPCKNNFSCPRCSCYNNLSSFDDGFLDEDNIFGTGGLATDDEDTFSDEDGDIFSDYEDDEDDGDIFSDYEDDEDDGDIFSDYEDDEDFLSDYEDDEDFLSDYEDDDIFSECETRDEGITSSNKDCRRE